MIDAQPIMTSPDAGGDNLLGHEHSEAKTVFDQVDDDIAVFDRDNQLPEGALDRFLQMQVEAARNSIPKVDQLIANGLAESQAQAIVELSEFVAAMTEVAYKSDRVEFKRKVLADALTDIYRERVMIPKDKRQASFKKELYVSALIAQLA